MYSFKFDEVGSCRLGFTCIEPLSRRSVIVGLSFRLEAPYHPMLPFNKVRDVVSVVILNFSKSQFN